MKREAKGRGMKGVRDNNQMNDSIQVFGFARKPIGYLHSLWQPMVSDSSGVIGGSSQETRQQTLAGRNDKVRRRSRKEEARWRKRCLTKRERERESASL